MSNRVPLQDGDRSPDYSVNRGSVAADRREDDQNPYTDEQPGRNAAPESGEAMNLTYKIGYLAPAKHQAPYSPIYMEGDTSGEGTVVHEVETSKYGDDFDPTAPMRVRMAPWTLDTDHDGKVN